MAKDKDDAKAKDDDKKKVAEKADGHAEGEGDAAAAAKPKGRFAFLNFSRKTLMFTRRYGCSPRNRKRRRIARTQWLRCRPLQLSG